MDAYSTHCQWALQDSSKINDGNHNNNTPLNATYDTNGLANTQNIISSSQSSFVDAPAAKYCYYYDPLTQTQTTDNTSRGWYLPAFAEQSMNYAQRVVINQTLKQLATYLASISSPIQATMPFAGVTSDVGYWTSTDYNDDKAYIWNQKGQTRNHPKTRSSGAVNYVRAVCSTHAQPGGAINQNGNPVAQTMPTAKIGYLVTFPDGSKGVVCYVNPENPYKGWAAALQDLGNPTNNKNKGTYQMGTMPAEITITIYVSGDSDPTY